MHNRVVHIGTLGAVFPYFAAARIGFEHRNRHIVFVVDGHSLVKLAIGIYHFLGNVALGIILECHNAEHVPAFAVEFIVCLAFSTPHRGCSGLDTCLCRMLFGTIGFEPQAIGRSRQAYGTTK